MSIDDSGSGEDRSARTEEDRDLADLLAGYNEPPDFPARSLREGIEDGVRARRRGGAAGSGVTFAASRPMLAAAAIALFLLGGATGFAVRGAGTAAAVSDGETARSVDRETSPDGGLVGLAYSITWM